MYTATTTRTLSPEEARNLAHMPKLTYRNAIPSSPTKIADDVASPSSITAPRSPWTDPSSPFSDTRSTASSNQSLHQRNPSLDSTPSNMQQSSSPSPSMGKAKKGPVNKKSGSFLSNMFTAREPSTAAFAQMEEQMKRQRETDPYGRINPVGMPGVSSAKMPDTVPRVNSKWNGLPAPVSEKSQQEKQQQSERKLSSSRSRSRKSESESRQCPSRDRPSSNSTLGSFDSRGRGSVKFHSRSNSIGSSVGNTAGGGSRVSGDRAPVAPTPASMAPWIDSSLPSPKSEALGRVPTMAKIPEQRETPRSSLIHDRATSITSADFTSSQMLTGIHKPQPSSHRATADLSPTSSLPSLSETSPESLDSDLTNDTLHVRYAKDVIVISSANDVLSLPISRLPDSGSPTASTDSHLPPKSSDGGLYDQRVLKVPPRPTDCQRSSGPSEPNLSESRATDSVVERFVETSPELEALPAMPSDDSDGGRWRWQGFDMAMLKGGSKTNKNGFTGKQHDGKSKVPFFRKS